MLFPQAVTEHFSKVRSFISSALLAILAFTMVYSFFNHQPNVNSWNISGVESTSVLNTISAYLGDFCRQYFGWSTLLIATSLIYTVICQIRNIFLSPLQITIFWIAPITMSFSSSIFFEAVPGEIPIQGGLTTLLAYKWFLFCFKQSKIYLYTISMILLNGIGIISLLWAYGFNAEKAIKIWGIIINSFEWLIMKIGKQSVIKSVKTVPQDSTPLEQTSLMVKPKKKKPQPVAQMPIIPGGDFIKPSSDLLSIAEKSKIKKLSQEELGVLAEKLQTVLQDFGVEGEITNMNPGPVVTLFEFRPAAGIKTSRVISLAEDIARSMSALSARIAVIPGKNAIGIELPNKHRQTVYMRSVLESPAVTRSGASLPLILGEDIGGEPIVADLARMPHLLIAGTTGSGKSVAVNAMILSLLYRYTPEQCKFIMVDPKMLELSIYDDIPHLLTPVVTDPKKAVIALKWAVKEMENRYRMMSKLGVRNIDGYNQRLKDAEEDEGILIRRVQTGFDTDSGLPIYENQKLDAKPFPYIVVIVDEMADLMLVAGKDIEGAVQRLAQMARAAGIHLIMATQRPSVDVITGTIKANFPTRISFQVTSKIDSRTILGEQGAEQLLGMGDMLYMSGGGRIKRVHGPFVKDEEVESVVSFLKSQGQPEYIDSVTEDNGEELGGPTSGAGESDDLYKQALDLIITEGKASTSFIQRHLQIGYNRAARIIDMMEKNGVVSPANHVGKREILLNR